MATRRNKNGTFSKRTTRRRRASASSTPRRSRGKSATSVLKVAETVLVASAITNGMFGAGLKQFFTGRTGTSTIYNPNVNDKVVTLPEMLGIDQMGMKSGQPIVYKQVDAGVQMDNVKANLKANWLSMGISIVAIPYAFKFGKKMLAKPIINPTTKLLKSVGIKEVKL